ncbi:hypothetical protein EJ08DRAFT_491383 [Tothia fuscella]|uniref:Uncharacterized protein n=1 Tax=Tothia fuscella TaxID=1048955 RepID=A0A9P4NHG5_9PEZI|nr:hypothetical protein EJ08DRAFT_491383 [Tothia fuscella]
MSERSQNRRDGTIAQMLRMFGQGELLSPTSLAQRDRLRESITADLESTNLRRVGTDQNARQRTRRRERRAAREMGNAANGVVAGEATASPDRLHTSPRIAVQNNPPPTLPAVQRPEQGRTAPSPNRPNRPNVLNRPVVAAAAANVLLSPGCPGR